MMIQLRALNGTGGGGDDGCLDGSAMSTLRAFYGTGRGGEDDCPDGSVLIQWRTLSQRVGHVVPGVVVCPCLMGWCFT